jgi:hypothetical protein
MGERLIFPDSIPQSLLLKKTKLIWYWHSNKWMLKIEQVQKNTFKSLFILYSCKTGICGSTPIMKERQRRRMLITVECRVPFGKYLRNAKVRKSSFIINFLIFLHYYLHSDNIVLILCYHVKSGSDKIHQWILNCEGGTDRFCCSSQFLKCLPIDCLLFEKGKC